MKARLLQKKLNTTRYIADYGDHIGIASCYTGESTHVYKKALKLGYYFDPIYEPNPAPPDNDELRYLWKNLAELIESGEIKDYLEGVDEVDNPVPLYRIEHGEIVTYYTDKSELENATDYPPLTTCGKKAYTNEYFDTPKKAIEQGIKDYDEGIRAIKNIIKQQREELGEMEWRLSASQAKLEKLKGQL